MLRVVFVCTGNTCRSPMAADVARRAWAARDIEVSSAGISAVPGQKASAHAQFVVKDRGGDLSAHRSRAVDGDVMGHADLILTMTGAQRDAVRRATDLPRETILTLGEFAHPDVAEHALATHDVADPFGGNLEDYESTHRQIQELVERATAPLDRILGARSRSQG